MRTKKISFFNTELVKLKSGIMRSFGAPNLATSGFKLAAFTGQGLLCAETTDGS